MQIEQLQDMQAYIRRTADDLELVSANRAGHLLYLERTSRAHEAQEVSERIIGLQASVDSLRGIFR
ncbi:hypothetical protein PSYJA_24483 [Pseudomonas syringae pv. japonica str. M301072]|uniref:Uncharacterized protein n=1 Tax=Pseudomonas syringae pv. japonica str. M301072 TaxID=629262 RepID=F3FP15_PSESX|nr:hypothetical protein PSYJA_24483 [Pseudomonas syringae pv. japonica str. M301072]